MKTRPGGLRTDLLPRCSHTNCKQWSPTYGIEPVGPLLLCGWGALEPCPGPEAPAAPSFLGVLSPLFTGEVASLTCTMRYPGRSSGFLTESPYRGASVVLLQGPGARGGSTSPAAPCPDLSPPRSSSGQLGGERL